MRLVLDTYWWKRGTQSLLHVAHGVLDAWSAEFVDDEIIIIVRRKDAPPPDQLPKNVRVVPTRIWPQALSAMLIAPWIAQKVQADATLTHNFTPLFGKRRSTYIQDVMFVTNPEWFTRTERAYYRWMVHSAKRAHVVFSSTESERARIAAYSNAPRVVRAGMGLSQDLIHGGAEMRNTDLRKKSFILAVGRLNVRKNLLKTLEGARLSGALNPQFPLVIVGERDGEWEDLPEWVREAEDTGEVQFTGFVSISELRWLIESCTLYVCLSLDEGFGLPPVEARSLGARVLVSDIAVFRETLAGLSETTFVDPLDASLIADEIARLSRIPNSGDRSDRMQIAARYNWTRVVKVMRDEILRELK